MSKLVEPNGNLIIYVDFESINRDIRHYLESAGIAANKLGENRQYVYALKHLASFANYINEDIFAVLPYTSNHTFFDRFILKKSNIKITAHSVLSLVLKKVDFHDNEAIVCIQSLAVSSHPDVINDDGTLNYLGTMECLQFNNAISGCIYLDRYETKKYLYLGKCEWKGLVLDGESYLAYGLGEREKEVTEIQEIPWILYDSMINPSKDKAIMEEYVFVELTKANSCTYKKGQDLDALRDIYERAMVKKVLSSFKKKKNLSEHLTSCGKWNMISFNPKVYLAGEQEIYIKNSDRLKSNDIRKRTLHLDNKDFLFYTRWK